MSAQQYRALLQRDINAGGCMEGSGLFTQASRIGLSEYQNFRAQHPGLPRAQLSALWHMHKTGGGLQGGRRLGGARVGGRPMGGFPGQREAFATIARAYPKSRATAKSLRAEAARPWKEDQQYQQYLKLHKAYFPSRPKTAKRDKAAADLWKRMRAMAMENPSCPPFGLRGKDKYDYAAIRHAANSLGIPPSAVELAAEERAERKAQKALARAAASAAADAALLDLAM